MPQKETPRSTLRIPKVAWQALAAAVVAVSGVVAASGSPPAANPPPATPREVAAEVVGDSLQAFRRENNRQLGYLVCAMKVARGRSDQDCEGDFIEASIGRRP